MDANQYVLFENQSADAVSPSKNWPGGVPFIIVTGTLDGASLQLQFDWNGETIAVGDPVTESGLFSCAGESLPGGIKLALDMTGAGASTNVNAWLLVAWIK